MWTEFLAFSPEDETVRERGGQGVGEGGEGNLTLTALYTSNRESGKGGWEDDAEH
jgi:hypothetical protein